MIPVTYTAFHGRGGQCDNFYLSTGSEACFGWPTFPCEKTKTNLWKREDSTPIHYFMHYLKIFFLSGGQQ